MRVPAPCVLLGLIAALIGVPALADPPAAQSLPATGATSAPPTIVLLIPFGPPENKDYQLDAATHDFQARLMAAKSFTVAISKPMDVMDVGGEAADLCKQFSASAIFLGTVRHEQNHNIWWGTYPTHAEVRVTELGCDGKIKWKGVGVGDKVQYWANPAAAVTNVIQNALDVVISEMP